MASDCFLRQSESLHTVKLSETKGYWLAWLGTAALPQEDS